MAPPSEGVLNQRFLMALARLNGRSRHDLACLAVLAFEVRGGRGSVLTFKILGPLEVVRDGESLPLGPAKQRALVACLLLHRGETVSLDRLADELWGREAPERADRNLHQYVFRLRKVLSDNGRAVLVTRPLGYQIELGPEDVVDADRFEQLVRDGREGLQGDPAAALELLERGLALWRGPALADFTYQGFAENSAHRLEELRASAEEARLEALLALGRERDAITEAESLARRFPLREHVRGLQMLALYRAGRQSEALGAYQDARQALAAELGIDPGRELRSLEEAILRHDPDLQLPTAAEPVEISSVAITRPASEHAGVTSPDGDVREPSHRRRRTGALAGATVVLIALATVIGVISLGDEPEPAGSPSGATPATPGELRLDWREASTADFVEEGNQRILGGVPTSSGFLVFGYTALPRATLSEPEDQQTAVWSGAPNEGWTSDPSPSFEGKGNQRATDAVVFRDGTVVLVGTDESNGDFDAAAWLSQNGSEWVSADDDAGALNKQQDQKIRDAVRSGEQLYAVGFTEDGKDQDTALWQSHLGMRWTFEQGSGPSESGLQQIASIVLSPDGFLLAGGSIEGDGDRDAAIWKWKPEAPYIHRVHLDDDLGGLGDQQINSITIGGPGFVAVGEENIDGDINAVVWTSTDGLAWDRVVDPSGAFSGDGAQRMYAVAASDVGLVAAGTDVLAEGVDETEPDGHWDAAVWTSIDGEHWIRLPGNDPNMSTLADLGHQEIKALLPIEGGFLALGAEGESGDDWDARVWIGTEVQP